MKEIWLDVVGYENFFKVSNLGNIYSKRSNKLIKPNINKNGYYQFTTRFNGRKSKSIAFKVHRLVADAFLEKPNDYLISCSEKTVYKKVLVNHKDCNKLNNSVENLEWCNSKQNSRHYVDNNPTEPLNRKFTLDQVSKIKDEYILGNISQRKLAEKYSVSRNTIVKLLSNKSYRQKYI